MRTTVEVTLQKNQLIPIYQKLDEDYFRIIVRFQKPIDAVTIPFQESPFQFGNYCFQPPKGAFT